MSSDTNIWKTGVNDNGNGTNNNQYFISDLSDDENRLTIQRGTGYIGVGTNEPSELLDVSGNIFLSGNIYLSDTGKIYKGDQEYGGGTSTLWTENSTKIYYNDGNVGINTNDPKERLEVVGSIKATNISGNGSGITNLDATKLTGTLDNARLPTDINATNISGNGSGITNLDATKLTGTLDNDRLPTDISVISLEGTGANITEINADNITSGTLDNDRLPTDISVTSLAGTGANITALNADNIASGTLDNARLPTDISVISLAGTGANITAINATNIASGTLDNARLPTDISVISLEGTGANITEINATNIASGTLNNDRLPADIYVDQIGIGTSTNHTNTLLDVRGIASFGDSLTVVQAIALKSQSGMWHIQSDNSGNAGNNQFVISSLRTINNVPNHETKFLLIDNITTYVGIGKTPAYKLDVDGDINCTGLRVNGNVFSSSKWTTTNSVDIKYNTGAVGINIGNSLIPNDIILDARGNVNVGDGLTSNQEIVIKSSLGYYSIGSDNSGGGTDSSGNLNSNQFYLYDNHNTSYIMTAQRTTGNVGIGNANRFSSYKLDVDGDINIKTGSKYKINGVNLSYANLDNTPFSSIDSSTLAVNSSGVLSVIGGGGTSSQWTTTGNDIYYNSVGKVGIGVVPGMKLDVGGDCKIQGNQYITGNLGVGVVATNTKVEIDGALRLTGSSAGNPGDNSSTNFWNQPGVGPTIAGYSFAVNTNGKTEAMRINDSGNVGIGRLPSRRLDVSDGTTITGNTASNTGTILRCVGALGDGKHNNGKAGLEVCHLNGSAGLQIGYTGIGQCGNGASYGVELYGRGNTIVSMYDNGGTMRVQVGANGDFDIDGSLGNLSDIRIKENITEIDDKEALNKILALQPKKYEYIDKERRGDKSVIGFIAQQVREVIPEAVKIKEKLAPNVLEWFNYIDGKLYINNPEIKIGTRINFRTTEDKNEGNTLKVKEIYDDYIEFDDEDGMKSLPSEDIKKLYIFGYEIKDFHVLDKAMIFSTNVCATQELHKIIMEQKEEINLLKEILTRNGIV